MPIESPQSLNLRLSLSAYPCTLPYAPRGGLEENFYAACDGSRTFGEVLALSLDADFPPEALESMAWLDRPLAGEEPAPAPGGTVVIAAHPQDGYLSMGGWLLNRAGAPECHYVSCYSQVAETTRLMEYVTPYEVAAIRRDEAGLCGRILGCRNRFLDLPEFEIRRANAEQETWGGGEKQLGNSLKLMLYRILEEAQPARIFAPAAIGDNPDQRMIFNAMLELFEDAWFPETEFHFYEDFPDSESYLAIDDFLARFESSYLDVEPWFENATDCLERKCNLLTVFQSLSAHGQSQAMRKIGRRNLLVADDLLTGQPSMKTAGSLERFWKLRTAEIYVN
jgi:LmbE family N-acetylglucosaminyl deacetylase